MLLAERRSKLNEAIFAIHEKDIRTAKRLFSDVFYGGASSGRSDPGMAGSLLYHMAMITKMETENKLFMSEFKSQLPEISLELNSLYGTFLSDAEELGKTFLKSRVDWHELVFNEPPSSSMKIQLFTTLNNNTREVGTSLNKETVGALDLEKVFNQWAKYIVQMRLRQEYETIKGLLLTSGLVKNLGISRVRDFMNSVKDRFGEETVRIALDVTLKVGMRREKLQSIMLSDHFINYTMDMTKLEGRMEFLNCPIFGSHKYMGENLGVDEKVSALFCTQFCYAHAKAMLSSVLPFTFSLWHPKLMSTHGICEFYLKLAHSPNAKPSPYVPLVISWNVTRKCNMKCSHCYINATTRELENELSTDDAKVLMDQISEVSRPLLILSGGEPLLRHDIFELIQYGSGKGFKMGLGSNGSLIDNRVANELKKAGITTVSVSLDSNISDRHDDFRGVKGSWEKTINAIKALREENILVQVNTTVTQQNYGEIEDIMSLAERIGVENFHLFFLVPTGRGVKMTDISPNKYENMIKLAFSKTNTHKLNVRPSCAPQFMRIAKDMGLDMRQWIRGCIAGLYYCRVYPNGDITPCPYLPLRLGNILEKKFSQIWFDSEVFRNLRDIKALKGKCGVCTYQNLCGGCRARAYGLSSDFIDFCGDLHEPAELKGDYLKEDPWCVYSPRREVNPRPLTKE
jgi:radical SAM protein with 4Fe4S-binding SPASM domain